MSDDDVAPAHGRRDRRRPVWGRADRRSLVTRLPVVLVLGAAVVGAVVVDAARERADGTVAGAEDTSAVMPVSPPTERGTSTWYCAAGTAVDDGFADHTVSIQNATDDDLIATVTVYAGDLVAPVTPAEGETTTATTAPPASTTTSTSAPATPVPAAPGLAPTPTEPVAEQVDLPAGTTTSVRLADVVEAPLAAALVEVDGADVAVEHRIAGPHGADAGPCSTFASPTWHFAWGTTARDARDIVVFFNPFPSSATVDARFVTGDGGREPVRFQGFPVPPGSVVGVDIGDDVTAADQVAASFRVRSGRVVVERLQEVDGSFGLEGLDIALGTPSPGTAWVFADGEASSAALGPPDPTNGERPRRRRRRRAGGRRRDRGREQTTRPTTRPTTRRSIPATTRTPPSPPNASSSTTPATTGPRSTCASCRPPTHPSPRRSRSGSRSVRDGSRSSTTAPRPVSCPAWATPRSSTPPTACPSSPSG